MSTRPALLIALSCCLAACTSTPEASSDVAPQDAFFQSVAALCGQAFAGRVEVDRPATPGDPFAGKPLIMHVRECSGDTIRIPFYVGGDRSRTWVLTRTATGLRLKHDHRHEDGTEDALSQYGGDTVDAGTAQRQEFPADAASKALFEREKRATSVANVWAMEVEPQDHFVYELARPGREFRVSFDLKHPIPAPPPPWGGTPKH
ncbi:MULTISPECIES: hypothetical protein [unclassified Lysobacter]|uniref:hypothetical protein n=1 Tax=unclassified Lysobacter TaxID=2635362 RepID=UPI001C226C7C|nr:hypothetical protein [Lysobacter sp. MMG2]MBU8977706.1 hypothetical protein [Lysobacter sp. MMG2]